MMGSLQLKESFQEIVTQHLSIFPDMEVDDLYKLVYQAAMGNEHAVANPNGVLNRLNEEVKGLEYDSGAPLVMPISPDHRLVRVELLPYAAVSGDLDALGQAFVETSQRFKSSTRRLDTFWSWVESLATKAELPFSPTVLKAYMERRRHQGYPAVHHSAKYRLRYHPAYRVVLKDLIKIPSTRTPFSILTLKH